MHYFNRIYKVSVPAINLNITQLRISFEVTKTNEDNSNEAKIQIYNLSENTRRSLTKCGLQNVQLYAGYSESGGLVKVCEGDLLKISTTEKTTGTTTGLFFIEGAVTLTEATISLSYKGRVNWGKILADATEQAALKLKVGGATGSTLSAIILHNGFSYVGKLSGFMMKLSEIFKVEWFISDGWMVVNINNQNPKVAVKSISKHNGLILNPTMKLDFAPKEKEKKNIYKVTSILRPDIKLNDVITVQSKTLTGAFKVDKIEHTGDTRGSTWQSIFDVISE